MKIKIKDLEEKVKKAFTKEPEEKPAVTNEMDITRCEKIVTSDGDIVYAYPEDLKSMEHSVCDFNQDSISDSKESRGDLLKETIEASKEFWKAIAGKRLLKKEEDDKKCVEAYKSIIDRAGYDILNGLGRGKQCEPECNYDAGDTAAARTEPAVVPVKPETHITEDGELGKYEFVNHPAHYNHYTKEVIDMMVDIFGREATALWCEMTAFKYRMRAGTKPGNEITEDMDKEKWYLDKAKELRK